MKVIVFGASGKTGLELLIQLLARGHEVTALVRNPDTFHLHFDRLKVARGDALQPDSFDRALEGQDAVVSTLGVTGFVNSLRLMTFYRKSAETIVGRMQTRGLKRLVVVSSVGVLDDPTTPIWYRGAVKPLLRHKYADMTAMEAIIEGSGLDWTIVRAAQLVDGPLTQQYRVGQDGNLPRVTKIARVDLANFLAEQAEGRDLVQRAVAISY